jgi:DNA polymerase-1
LIRWVRANNCKCLSCCCRRYKGRSERAAINTPIQGSAADVASAAMLSIVRDEALRDMGWRLLLQVG